MSAIGLTLTLRAARAHRTAGALPWGVWGHVSVGRIALSGARLARRRTACICRNKPHRGACGVRLGYVNSTNYGVKQFCTCCAVGRNTPACLVLSDESRPMPPRSPIT
eukprot:3350011-Prymnesium_polylepis.1